MAVSPALTYPSKSIRMGWTPNLVSIYLIRRRAVNPNMIAELSPTAISEPRLMVRSTSVKLFDSLHQSNQARVFYVLRKRRQLMVASNTVMQTFPIPYLGRTTTRPPYGEQWPRFAVYGSVV